MSPKNSNMGRNRFSSQAASKLGAKSSPEIPSFKKASAYGPKLVPLSNLINSASSSWDNFVKWANKCPVCASAILWFVVLLHSLFPGLVTCLVAWWNESCPCRPIPTILAHAPRRTHRQTGPKSRRLFFSRCQVRDREGHSARVDRAVHFAQDSSKRCTKLKTRPKKTKNQLCLPNSPQLLAAIPLNSLSLPSKSPKS